MFSIITNSTAIGAQGSVTNANNTLSKTIQQLSTGLRINSAADDASGLAVSEKLRGQISGLKVASRNAQDGISFLQTAEANMGTMTSMVQRIRELAVQSGDPAYTSSDRVMLQTEVDQLKSEINRVSASAEFNTKKLLNGDSAALWSSTGGIEAIVKGATVEGNYNVTTTLTPGTNYVYKSNVMALGVGQTSFDITGGGSGIARLDNIKNVLTNANTDVAFSVNRVATVTGADAETTTVAGAGFNLAGGLETAVGTFSIEVETVKNRSANATVVDALRFRVQNTVTGKTSEWYTASTSSASTNRIIAGGTKAQDAFKSVGLSAAITVLSGADTLTANTALTAGTRTVVFSASTANSTLAHTASKNMGIYGSIASDTMVVGNWAGSNVRGGSVAVEVEALSDKAAADAGKLRYRVTNLGTGTQSDWYEFNVIANGTYTSTAGEGFGNKALTQVGMTGSLMTDGTVSNITTSSFKKGDKYLVGITGVTFLAPGASAIVTNTGGSVEFGTGPQVRYKELVKQGYENSIKMYTAQMDGAGKIFYGSMDALMSKATSTTQALGTSQVRLLGEGDAASKYTKLSQVGKFTNADGRVVINNTQELTIYGNNKQALVTIEANDTIDDFQQKMSAAVIDQLGMGGAGTGVNANLMNYVTDKNSTVGGNQAVKGTFILQGAKLGEDSQLSFSGNQGIITALGFQTIQTGTGSTINATVTNAHTGATVGKDTITDGILRNVIQNVDVKIDQTQGTNIAWDDVKKQLTFVPDGLLKTSTLHLVNNATVAAVGANEGQTLDISIGRMDTTSLNLDGVNVLTVEAAQKSITKLDESLDTINKGRAIVGAQMNRLNYTINNLNTSRENMMAADSRIRDLDIAEASTNLAAQQVRLQAANAMLAQANQLPTYAAQLLR